MRKRLVRKAFDMILGISMSENREVYYYSENCSLYTQFLLLFLKLYSM